MLRLISALDRCGMAYCLVGDTRGFPKNIQSDVDFVVRHAAPAVISGMLARFCAEEGLRLVQVLQHEQTAWYYVLTWVNEQGRLCFLSPDFCDDFYHLGRRFLGADELLEHRVDAGAAKGQQRAFQVLAPAWEFIYYLLKKIDKQQFDARHGEHLSEQWRQDPAGAMDQLRRFWPETEVTLLSQAARENAWENVIAVLPRLQALLHGGLPFSANALWLEWRRKVRRVCQPTGVSVAILGPDGSGKSSVIAQVLTSLAPAFRRAHRIHLRPKLWGKEEADAAPVTNPHQQAPRGWWASMAKLVYWWFDYTAGYFLSVRPRQVRSTLIIFDRYYFDLLVDRRRYRYSGPQWLARVVGAFIPHPDLLILLDAPVETLRQRKREVEASEIGRQREAYRKEVERFAVHRIVDASRPLQMVVADVEQTILDFMAQRFAKRLRQ